MGASVTLPRLAARDPGTASPPMLARNPHEFLPLSRTRRPESGRSLERESHCARKQAETRLAATCCTRAMICSGHNPGGGVWYGLLPGLLLSPWSVVLIFHLDGMVELLFMTEASQRRAPPAPPPSSHAPSMASAQFALCRLRTSSPVSDTLGGGSIEPASVYPDACARAAHSEKKFFKHRPRTLAGMIPTPVASWGRFQTSRRRVLIQPQCEEKSREARRFTSSRRAFHMPCCICLRVTARCFRDGTQQHRDVNVGLGVLSREVLNWPKTLWEQHTYDHCVHLRHFAEPPAQR